MEFSRFSNATIFADRGFSFLKRKELINYSLFFSVAAKNGDGKCKCHEFLEYVVYRSWSNPINVSESERASCRMGETPPPVHDWILREHLLERALHNPLRLGRICGRLFAIKVRMGRIMLTRSVPQRSYHLNPHIV
jgi:hypothetical protein